MSAAAEWSLAWVICRASEGKAVALSLRVTTAVELSLDGGFWFRIEGIAILAWGFHENLVVIDTERKWTIKANAEDPQTDCCL